MTPLSFPDDENGDVLRRMQDSGDDLTKARKVEFQHVFPVKIDAISFLAETADESVEVTIGWYADARCWNVQVARSMVPSHEDISSMEGQLDRIARTHRGRADGWGCFEVRQQSDS